MTSELQFRALLATLCALFVTIAVPLVADAQNPQFEVRLSNMEWWLSGQGVEVDVELSATQGGVEGLWLGICMSDARLQGTGINILPALQILNGGAGPDVFMLDVDPIGGSGVTCGTIFSNIGAATLGPVTQLPILEMTYSAAGLPINEVVQLSFCDSLGPSSFVTEVIAGGVSHTPATVGTLVFYTGPTTLPFLRGDSNGNGNVDIADAVSLLSHLFNGGVVHCDAASDSNADGSLDIGDAITLLNYLYNEGASPPHPFPTCGPGSAHAFGCTSYIACP
ncbi:MAG: dockerin type I repeat-containing protein [Planctomycetota bacterium]